MHLLIDSTGMKSMKQFRILLLWVLLAVLSACASTTAPLLSGLSLSDEPLTGKFIWHDLVTTDLAASKRFYQGLFGWQYEQRRGPNRKNYTLAKVGDHYVAGMVSEVKVAEGADISRWLGYLSVQNVDGAVHENEAAGGKTVVSPKEISDFVRVAAIIDPQGAVLGLAQSHIGDPDDSYGELADHVVWNELLAADVATATEFYQKLVGYKVKVVKRNGGQYTMLLAEGEERAGILRNPLNGVAPMWLTYFGVTDVHAAAARASKSGGTVVLAPSPAIRDGKLALVVGPSGELLALQQLL